AVVLADDRVHRPQPVPVGVHRLLPRGHGHEADGYRPRRRRLELLPLTLRRTDDETTAHDPRGRVAGHACRLRQGTRWTEDTATASTGDSGGGRDRGTRRPRVGRRGRGGTPGRPGGADRWPGDRGRSR